MSMTINLSIEFLTDNPPKSLIWAAILEAAERAAGQLEFDIIPVPEVDDAVELGSDLEGVERAQMFRSE